jgi:hypothetical protein
MTTHRKPVLSALAFASVTALALPAAAQNTVNISVDLFRMQGSIPSAPWVFYAIPQNWSDPAITSITIQNASGNLNGSLTGSGSPAYSSFGALASDVTGGSWTMTINGTSTYSFTIGLDPSLSELSLPPVTVATPVPYSTGVLLTPTYNWNDPSVGADASFVAFNSVSYDVIPNWNGGFGYPPSQPLNLHDTSVAQATPLLGGLLYGFTVIYTRPAPEITLATSDTVLDPADPTGGTTMSFTLSGNLWDQGASPFTTVPEPATFAGLAGLGLLGFAGVRRLRA